MAFCPFPDSDKLPQDPISRKWKESVQFGTQLSSTCVRGPEWSRHLKSSSSDTDVLPPLRTPDSNEELDACRIIVADNDDATIEYKAGHRGEKGFRWEHPQKLQRGDDIWAEFPGVTSPTRHTQARSSDWINLSLKKKKKKV